MSATPVARPRPGQVYEGPDGPTIWVRREAGEEVFVATRDRVVYTRRFPEGEVPPELELVHDPPCGCGESHYCESEARSWLDEIDRLRGLIDDGAHERGALVEAMRVATSILDAADAKRVRDAYSKALLA